MFFPSPAAAVAHLEATHAADTALIVPPEPAGTLNGIASAVPANEIPLSPGMARLVALHDPDFPPVEDLRADTRVARRCDSCLVGWKGTPDDLCWRCGNAGAPGSQSLSTGCGHEPVPHVRANGPNTCTPPCPCEAITQEPPPCP